MMRDEYENETFDSETNNSETNDNETNDSETDSFKDFIAFINNKHNSDKSNQTTQRIAKPKADIKQPEAQRIKKFHNDRRGQFLNSTASSEHKQKNGKEFFKRAQLNSPYVRVKYGINDAEPKYNPWHVDRRVSLQIIPTNFMFDSATNESKVDATVVKKLINDKKVSQVFNGKKAIQLNNGKLAVQSNKVKLTIQSIAGKRNIKQLNKIKRSFNNNSDDGDNFLLNLPIIHSRYTTEIIDYDEEKSNLERKLKPDENSSNTDMKMEQEIFNESNLKSLNELNPMNAIHYLVSCSHPMLPLPHNIINYHSNEHRYLSSRDSKSKHFIKNSMTTIDPDLIEQLRGCPNYLPYQYFSIIELEGQAMANNNLHSESSPKKNLSKKKFY